MQAQNPEGSLKTQLQRLRAQLTLKQNQTGEVWREVMLFELRAIKGSQSLHSDELRPLYDAIREGRVNTVMFTALNRLCRSVKDFLGFVEFLQDNDANFISMKEDYDTTTAHGRLILTLLMALAEFEREQTAERTRDAFQARSERGLWNGGRVIGYDLDPVRKGYLVPSEDEADLVNFAFDSYLDLGSIAGTVDALNRAGYRTKAYRSRREVEHAPHEFRISTVQQLLKNVTYIAKKRVTDEDGERLVDASGRPSSPRDAETYIHSDEQLARPDIGVQAQFRKRKPPKTYRFDPTLDPELAWNEASVEKEVAALWNRAVNAATLEDAQDALQRLNQIARPSLRWAGKAERPEMTVPTLPLFVHERLSTKGIIESLQGHKRDKQMAFDFFGDPQLPIADRALKAYEHKDRWVNRLILGDSLQVMNSLLEYEAA